MGPQEPYWRTNSTYSPPPSRWDFRFQSEALSFGSHDGVQLVGSSASSNSRESRSWMRGNQLTNHQFTVNDGGSAYFSSPSDISPMQQWTPPAIQEISIDDFHASNRDLRPLPFSPAMEGTSAARDSRGSTSSRSDSSDYDSMTKTHHHNHRNFTSRRCFMSKPVHPLSFPSNTSQREPTDSNGATFLEFDASATPRREKSRLSSESGSLDLTDISEPFEAEFLTPRPRNPPESFRCGLCERLLSQRSPWSSRRIVRSGDMPVAGVLSCRHVFHAECLDQTTPKPHKNDPPCPICTKAEEEASPEQKVFSKFFPRLKPFSEDGTSSSSSSKPWGCVQAGDCVPSRSTMLSLARSRIKKNLSMKGNVGKEFPGKPRKSGSFSSQMFVGSAEHGVGGSSKAAASGLK